MSEKKNKSAWDRVNDRANQNTSDAASANGAKHSENNFNPGAVRKDIGDDSAPGNEDITPEANLTNEDMEALGPKDLSMDMGDDELLKHRVYPVNFSGDDLDVPGAELDDEDEEHGSEDEENNSYSLGGDQHDD